MSTVMGTGTRPTTKNTTDQAVAGIVGGSLRRASIWARICHTVGDMNYAARRFVELQAQLPE
jgi:hypothetical protein